MADNSGNARIGMDLYSEGPSMFLRDSEGNLRLGLDLDGDDAAIVTMADRKGGMRLTISTRDSDDSTRITLQDAIGAPRLEVRSQGGDHSVSMIDSNGMVRTIVSADGIISFRRV